MNKKYVLCPGYIISRTDGQEHYISASQLAKLYNVPMSECIISDPCHPELSIGINLSQYKHLVPLFNGDYNLTQM